MWGFSSAGRAPALHAGGQEFESPNLQNKRDIERCPFYFGLSWYENLQNASAFKEYERE